MKNTHDVFGDVSSFLQHYSSPPTRFKLLDILNDLAKCCKVQIELAITIDAGEPFEKSSYRVEGDSPLVFAAFEEITALMQLFQLHIILTLMLSVENTLRKYSYSISQKKGKVLIARYGTVLVQSRCATGTLLVRYQYRPGTVEVCLLYSLAHRTVIRRYGARGAAFSPRDHP